MNQHQDDRENKRSDQTSSILDDTALNEDTTETKSRRREEDLDMM